MREVLYFFLQGDELDQAKQEAEEVAHSRLIRQSSKELLKDKRGIQKGLKVLGYDPSEAKLEEKFGESSETLHRKSQFDFMHQQSLTLFQFFSQCLLCSAIFCCGLTLWFWLSVH